MIDRLRKWIGQHKVIVAVVIVVLLAVLVAAIAWLVWQGVTRSKNDETSTTPMYVCGWEQAYEAAPFIIDNKTTELGKIVDTTIEKDGYKQDIDCAYILTRYYIMTGQSDEAKASLADVRTQLDKGQSLSDGFGGALMSYDELKVLVDDIESYKQNIELKQENDLDEIDKLGGGGQNQ
ncbi:hypothetical protein CR983_00465 [Candidatus Saccharibacteria bacterium]|nr:MAG: hypothetical protein CR983_00465 [Candidatus Saccharibacteria bacterium]